MAQKRLGQRQKILVLTAQGGRRSDQLLAALACGPFEVTVSQTVEEALEILKSGQFDAILSATSDFLPLERASVSYQAEAIINTLGEGVCLVGPDGTVLWANRRMEGFTEAVQQGVYQRARQGYEHFAQRLAAQQKVTESVLRPRKYSYRHEQTDRYYEMIVTPMLDSDDKLRQVAAVIWEETSSRRLQQRIDAIDKAGSELVRLDAESLVKMTVEQRIQLLQDKIISCARKLLHFDNFVVRILNKRSNQLEVLFGVGLQKDEQTEIFASVENNGITGYVAATGRSYICNNPANDGRYLPGLSSVKSCLTVPLRLYDTVVGTLNVESLKESAFSEDDRQMAEIFGRHIAIALNILDLLVVERYETTGQTAESFAREVSDPLNDIMTDASILTEEYIGHDELRRRLGGIIDNVVQIKESVKQMRQGPKGILDTKSPPGKPKWSDLAGKQILVVDDEKFIRQTIADVVQRCGCLVDLAADGRQAIALLGQRSYDLVLSDIKLPYADGYEVFAAARRDRDVPVILMTGFGYDPNHSIVRANREGLFAVLYKPFKVDQLMNQICKALKENASQ